MDRLINKIREFSLSGKIFNKLNIAIIFAVVFFIAFIVKAASSPYSANISGIDTSAYPMVRLNVDLSAGMETNLTARNFSVIENGKKNNGPIVILPPGTYNNTIDLFILLDRSGNTKAYDKIIKSNLRALVRYMKDKNVNLNIKLATFGSTDKSYSLDLQNFSGNYSGLNDILENMVFDGARVERVYGLEKLFSLAEQSYRSDSEKVALIINGSQFYDKGRGENSVNSLSEAINMLASKNFTIFVSGLPIKQMVKNTTANTEDASLAHSLKGGYLGSFSSDFTAIYDLLNKKTSGKYTVQYFSELPPETGANANIELDINGYSVNSFVYPQINSTQPDIIHDPQPALMGAPYNVKIQLNNHDKFINAVELVYWGDSGNQKSLFLEHRKNEDTAGSMIYETDIPAEDVSGKNIFYYYILHTPFNTVNLYADVYAVQVLEYDAGITLIPQLVNNKEVLWRWEGDTVDKGSKYQLYNGDNLLTETSDRHFTIPLGNCDLYQIVKLRVLVRSGTEHPRAGGWSLFSLPAEYYAGQEGTVTEKTGTQKMFECLKEKKAISLNDFVANKPDYSANSELYLNKMLEYMTGIFDTALGEGMTRDRYPTLYYFMHFINNEEMRLYGRLNNKIPYKILYKVITGINQTNDFPSAYHEAKNQVAQWMLGHFSF
jgi:hypothetical protein